MRNHSENKSLFNILKGFILLLAFLFVSVAADNSYLHKKNDAISLQFVSHALGAISIDRNKVFRDENRYEIFKNEVSTTETLSDPAHRVHEAFRIPEELKPRVAFWLDIYTKYTSQVDLIHHSDYPWIVYSVVDQSSIFNASNTNKYTKYFRAEKAVKDEKKKVIATLAALAKKKNYEKLSQTEQKIFDLLKDLPGKRQVVFTKALHSIRTQKGQRDFYEQGLLNGAEYFQMMEEIFAQSDLPIEITRLPLVESSFNQNAVSKVGASGIWQFMPAVGKHYLRLDDQIDERNSPLKATKAASKMMLQNYKILKSWPLVMTAYNHGVGGVKKAIAKTGSTDLAEIIKKYHAKSFGFASENFFCGFLAAVYAERYQEKYFGDLPKAAPLAHDNYKITKPLRIQTAADVAGITLEEVRLFNPDIKRTAIKQNIKLPRGYVLHVPQGKSSRLELVLNQKGKLVKRQSSLDKEPVVKPLKEKI